MTKGQFIKSLTKITTNYKRGGSSGKRVLRKKSVDRPLKFLIVMQRGERQ